jgi:hypothetical protein
MTGCISSQREYHRFDKIFYEKRVSGYGNPWQQSPGKYSKTLLLSAFLLIFHLFHPDPVDKQDWLKASVTFVSFTLNSI